MLLVSACLAGPLGCATGTWPSAVADRTLTLPKGEHQLLAHAGVGKDIAGLRSDIEPVGGGSYAYGITDRLQFSLPLIMAYRLGGARHDLLVSGGVTGAGYRSARPLEALDDPRLRRPTASSFLLGVGAQVATRVHLAPGRALDTSLVAGSAQVVVADRAIVLYWAEDRGDLEALADAARAWAAVEWR